MEPTQFTPHSYNPGGRIVVSPLNEEMYATKDIILAAALSQLKFTIDQVDYELGGQQRHPTMIFSFKNSPVLQETLKRYMQGQLAVEPRTFMNIVRSLKAQAENYRGSFENEVKSEGGK